MNKDIHQPSAFDGSQVGGLRGWKYNFSAQRCRLGIGDTPLPDNAALTCFGRGGGGEWQGSFSPSHKVRFGTSYLQDCAIPFLGTVIITRHGGALVLLLR